MGNIFLKTLNMSIAASWLIFAVVLLRFVMKKTPKWIVVLLWGIVALRLVVPFSFESTLSLIPSAETFHTHNISYKTPVISSGIPAVNNAVNPILGETFAPNSVTRVNPPYTGIAGIFIMSVIWLIGIAAMLLYAGISYVQVHQNVVERVPYEGNIFLCDHIKSPFILGLVQPKIYLPSNMNAITMEPVIAHEKAHLARHDHWWKPLGFLILAAHWFNPLCWVAYVLLCRDIELACDEKVIQKMDLDGKKNYSAALLECSIQRRLITICPLDFGEISVKERVKNVLNYKKPTFWVVVAAVIACAVVTVCFATNPVQNSVDLVIHLPAGSEERVFYTDEEVSSQSGIIEIITNQDLGDIMIQLLPTEVHEENAYDEPQYITPGMSVKFQVEKGAWFRIGIVPLLVEDMRDISISVKNVNVRIASRTESRKLTLDDVIMLSQKGDTLTWTDFEQYQGRDIGSGLYIMRYEIDELFDVLVGGIPEEMPMYIYLRANNEEEDRIDIRTENVPVFIDAHRNDMPKAIESKADGGSKPIPEEPDFSTLFDERTAIYQAILEHNCSTDPTGLISCVSFVELACIVVDGSDFSQYIHYGWALYEEYRVTENGLETVSGSHIPIAITLREDPSGTLTWEEYWEPRDGSYYVQDIREKFPAHIAEDGIDSQKFILQQKQECYSQAVAATGLDTNKIVRTLIKTICSSPAQSSNPMDYIKEHSIEYRELTYYGQYTLKYCFSQFEESDETGLTGQIMAQVCEDIAVGWGEEPFISSLSADGILTGETWYSAFKNNALSLLDQYQEIELATYYPASYLLLTMFGKTTHRLTAGSFRTAGGIVTAPCFVGCIAVNRSV